ncbi:MAG: hypothetical protein II943_08100 [Victivallales bacterium]|nr:hypothetical protein [Victivallales bacterium]
MTSMLPKGNSQPALNLAHFPARWQAVVWRNWGMVPVARLAKVLRSTAAFLAKAAEQMGLEPRPFVDDAWLKRGYQTIIRNNWHLLDYPQLLELLDWPPEHLEKCLREEDFLWIKLGSAKPDCGEVIAKPLSDEELAVTQMRFAGVRELFANHPVASAPFDFYHSPSLNLPERPLPDWCKFNFIHPYSISCGDLLSVDAPPPEELLPAPLLEQYQRLGIQGLWFHAVMMNLHPVPGAEEYSQGWEGRLAKLKILAEYATQYGLKLYLYINEPRGMSGDFYERKPEWRGGKRPDGSYSTCTTRTPEPLQWLEEACAAVFEAVPQLGGVLSINMSENKTHCFSHWDKDGCPSCREIPGPRIIAECLNAVERGVHRAAPTARVMAYAWGWVIRQDEHEEDYEANVAFCRQVRDALNPGIDVVAVPEHGLPIRQGGITTRVIDYSISQKGVSRETAAVWRLFHEDNRKVFAKIQLNNSWELSALPWLPIPFALQENLQEWQSQGVDGLMLSWTLGSYPGGNLALLSRTPQELAADLTTDTHEQESLLQAWHLASDAFRRYPFDLYVLYFSPLTLGPRNLFFLKPTGYQACMVNFCYDDLKLWCGPYPPEFVAERFHEIGSSFERAAELLPTSSPAIREQRNLLQATGAIFQSGANHIDFVQNRENAPEKLPAIIKAEIHCAKTLLDCQAHDARIGFEASNHYFFTRNDLVEKILNCQQLLESV